MCQRADITVIGNIRRTEVMHLVFAIIMQRPLSVSFILCGDLQWATIPAAPYKE